MSLASIPQNSRLGRSLSVLRDVTSRPSGAVGLSLVLFHLILAVISPYIAPFDYRTMNAAMMLTGPDGVHWLGTDHQGRDIFSQIVHGGRDVIAVGLAAGAISTLIGVTFGTLAGFVGGRLDSVIIAITDFVLTVPRFPLLVVLAAIVTFDRNVYLGVILGLLNIGQRTSGRQ